MRTNTPTEPVTTEVSPKAVIPAPSGRTRRIRRVVLRSLGVLGLILLVAVVVVYVLFRQELSEARQRLENLPSTVYSSPYGDIQYHMEGEGPTVLVLHGITGGIDQGMSLKDAWGNLGEQHRYVYVSRFGYLGSSVPEAPTARLQAAAYKDLLDHLGIDRVVVLGNSGGGPSAMWFAIDYPERTNGLILLSSAVPGPEPDPIPKLVARSDFVYWAAVKFQPDMLLGLFLPDSIISSMTVEEKDFVVENAFMASMPISERTEGIRFDNDIAVPSVNEIPFEQIEVPTIIFQAVDDPREARGGLELANRIAGSEYVGLTGGHVLLGHGAEIQAATDEFIARYSDSSSP
jgi:pimeloyl-ACP methyl ester carboxylesterase